MSRVFNSASTGAAVYVFTDDHCPPHVHARHRGEEWVARLSFSYLGSAVTLMSIAPTKNVPAQRVINQLLRDVQEQLSGCREYWWTIRRTACLTNQWARVSAAGKVELHADRRLGAKQIADAQYEPRTERLLVTFLDGSTTEVRLQP
jgi:hypothetical protein